MNGSFPYYDREKRARMTGHENFNAYTVADLGELLPTDILNKSTTYWLNTARMSHGWSIGYVSRRTEYSILNDIEIIGVTEADARGLMLIYLLENNLISK